MTTKQKQVQTDGKRRKNRSLSTNKDWRVSTTRCDRGVDVQNVQQQELRCIVVALLCS